MASGDFCDQHHPHKMCGPPPDGRPGRPPRQPSDDDRTGPQQEQEKRAKRTTACLSSGKMPNRSRARWMYICERCGHHAQRMWQGLSVALSGELIGNSFSQQLEEIGER
eukprot:5543054-Amphidinium_carterae.2